MAIAWLATVQRSSTSRLYLVHEYGYKYIQVFKTFQLLKAYYFICSTGAPCSTVYILLLAIADSSGYVMANMSAGVVLDEGGGLQIEFSL